MYREWIFFFLFAKLANCCVANHRWLVSQPVSEPKPGSQPKRQNCVCFCDMGSVSGRQRTRRHSRLTGNPLVCFWTAPYSVSSITG